MKAEHSDYRVVTSYLKGLLKQQKLTYRDLASGIGLSESGVKKVLGAEDGSFQRLSQICSYLGVTLGDALKGIAETERPVRFSQKQQEFLLREPQAFALYWRLVYERKLLATARSEMSLNANSAFSLLRQLDQHGLLKLLPGDRVQIPPVQLIRWTGTGPLVEKLYRDWSLDVVRSVAHPQAGPDRFFLIRYFKVKPKTFADLTAAMADLENEFTRRAIQDMRSEDETLMHLRWVGAVDQRSFLS